MNEMMEEIRERVENAPRLLVSKADEGGRLGVAASVYEEEDGLNTLCYLPSNYGEAVQNYLAAEIVAAYEDRERLLSALDAVISALAEEGLEDAARDLANRAVSGWSRFERV